MFINVQPYVAHTLNMGAAGYSNPFTINFNRQQVTTTTNKPFDIENFDLSSHEGDSSSQEAMMMSMDYEYGTMDNRRGEASALFKSEMRTRAKGERYQTLSAQKSEGEVGMAESDSMDEISLGEIRIPSTNPPNTIKQGSSSRHQYLASAGRQTSSTMTKIAASQAKVGGNRLAETINYEEDKDLSPEKDDEKPIYESSEGPIPKKRTRAIPGSKVGVVGKSGANNMINSGESFGISAIRSGGGLQRPPGGSYLRDTIKDNFLNEIDDVEDDMASIRGSAESGEIFNPSTSNFKRR